MADRRRTTSKTDLPTSVAFRNPWDLQEGETAKAFRAFQTYCHLGPSRTLADASELFYSGGEAGQAPATDRPRTGQRKKSHGGQFRVWSRKFYWAKHADAHEYTWSGSRPKSGWGSTRSGV